MAWVEKRKNGYRTVWEPGGGLPRRSLTWDTEPTAIYAKAIVDAQGNQITVPDLYLRVTGKPYPITVPASAGPSFQEWAAKVLARRLESGKIDKGCFNTYTRQLDSVVSPIFGHLPLADVTPDHITELIKHLRDERGFQPATVTRYYSVVFMVLEAATDDPAIRLPFNPAKLTGFRRATSDAAGGRTRPEDKWQEVAEFEMIYRRALPDAQPLIRFLAETGARINEATALRVCDFEPDANVITIRRAWRSLQKGGRMELGAPKDNESRQLVISPDLSAVLRVLCGDRGPQDWVFRAPRGGPVVYTNFYNRRWLPAVRAASFCPEHPPASPKQVSPCRCSGVLHKRPNIHSIRHSYTTWMLDHGRTNWQVAKDLGHSTTAMVDRVYGHVQTRRDTSRATMIAGILPALAHPSG